MAKRIVLVEDDKETKEQLNRVLSALGYSIMILEDGKAILDDGFDVPDLFILNNSKLPIGCVALCKYLRLKQETRHVPVIIIADDKVKQKASRAGADVVLLKPFCIHELVEKIDLTLHQSEQYAT